MVNKVMVRLYPEIAAGGYTRGDNLLLFWSRVHALLEPHYTVLDFGAGRGWWADRLHEYRFGLRDLRGRCKKMIGVDVTPEVHDNPVLGEAHVVEPGRSLPFGDATFDVIVSWAVFEHIEDADGCARELERVLRPGGWICAWTPNRWGLTTIAAQLVPYRLHGRLLRRLGTLRPDAGDVFPTYYRMNTRRALRGLFPAERWDHHSYVHNGPAPFPQRLGATLGRLVHLYDRFTPECLGRSLFVFLRKR
jgi:SAM-dependent methyltransferase